jgi:hypothetical protein
MSRNLLRWDACAFDSLLQPEPSSSSTINHLFFVMLLRISMEAGFCMWSREQTKNLIAILKLSILSRQFYLALSDLATEKLCDFAARQWSCGPI